MNVVKSYTLKTTAKDNRGLIKVSVSFLGGSSRGRAPWRGGTDAYRERSHPDDEWQTARGSRRSYHDHDDVRWGSSSERLPEWSNDDSDDFKTPGTFDSSGAFVSKVTPFLAPDQHLNSCCLFSCIFCNALKENLALIRISFPR